MEFYDPSPENNTGNVAITSDTTPVQDEHPPVGITPPQVLAQEAADGHRGAAWRLMHWIMDNDPRALIAVTSLEDNRLAQHLIEFLALGTWAGKPFTIPISFRLAHFRTRLRTFFLPESGMDPARVEQVLLTAARDKRPAVRETAVHILGLVGSRTATPALIKALHDPVLPVQLQAIKALGRTHDPAAIPPLFAILHSANEQLGSQISQALVNLGSMAVPELLKESHSPSAWMRWQSARVMGELCDQRALPALVRMLADNDYSVAWMAAKSLVHYGQDSLVPVLQQLVTAETSSWVANAGAYVLRNLYTHNMTLKPYLLPVEQAMHGVSYNIATPNAARKALAKLAADGVVKIS